MLSYKVGGFGMGSSSSDKWAGRSSFFEFAQGTFPRGFVSIVAAGLKQRGHEIQLVRHPFPAALGPEKPKVDNFPEDLRYDYQAQVVDKLMRHGQIIAQVATGGGKSR